MSNTLIIKLILISMFVNSISYFIFVNYLETITTTATFAFYFYFQLSKIISILQNYKIIEIFFEY